MALLDWRALQCGSTPCLLHSSCHAATLAQMDAVAVEVLPPAAPASRSATSLRVQRPPAQLSGLDDLLGALGCCFDAPCHPLLRLAVLLSAAAAGVQEAGLEAGEGSDSDEEPESWVQRSTCTSRAQVGAACLLGLASPIGDCSPLT